MRWRAFVAAALLWTPAHADDGARPHLGVTRGDFFAAIHREFPGLEAPAMPCGAPLVLKYCNATLRSGVRVFAAETYAHNDDIARFTMGAEGMLYMVRVVSTDAPTNQGFVEFYLYCAALAWIGGAAADLESAAVLVTNTMADAVASVADGYGSSVNRDKPSRFAIEHYPGLATECIVTAQWFDE
jgi:hypothetical protein